MRFFNTAGPCDPRFHYMLPAAERLPEVPRLVERGMYFVVHAPRQTGKTTSLRALAKALTAQDRFAVLHVTCETGEVAGDDYASAQHAILTAMRMAARTALPPALQPPDDWSKLGADPGLGLGLGRAQGQDLSLLALALESWARACPRPLALFLDEIDALRGKSLLAVLRQLRAGYHLRPDAAPWSVILCGMRDVRDYKTASGSDEEPRLGSASPFNIKVDSMRLGDFSAEQVAALYDQHTAETGQPFAAEAIERAFALTRGQPWLVNALAREIIEQMGVSPPTPITVEHVEQAKEHLILARATHLDSLVARLSEPRVRRVIEPLLAGATIHAGTYDDDVAYARDLGLVTADPVVQVANPIYREVIARVLAAPAEGHVQIAPRAFVRADGQLDMAALLAAFLGFWKQHGEILTSGMVYHEVAPQLVLMAFLQRVVNGGGYVDREYGIGRGRIDLLIRWPYADEHGVRQWQREAAEIKVWREHKADPLARGLEQLDAYLERCGLGHGALVVFDRRPGAPPITERTQLTHAHTPGGKPVILLRA